MDWSFYFILLGWLALVAIGAWLWSLVRDDVSHVDSLWSLMFLLIAGACFFGSGSAASTRGVLLLLLTAAWSLRLAWHITLRNHGQPEDRRYQAIRRNNEPNFRFKSLYIVFGLQAVLAWLIAMPLAVAIGGSAPLNSLDLLALLLWLVGMGFEVIGDAQLARFRKDPANQGRVMDRGLWRYTRHPNYFGECLIWWSFWLFAVAAGGAWTLLSPLLMTVLLLRVSGVALLEKDIAERRPGYAAYVRSTNAFIPWLPRQ